MIVRTVSVFKLISFVNLVIIICYLWLVFSEASSLYVHQSTLLLAITLAVLNHFINQDAKANKNALLLILSIWNLAFVELRVLTLEWTEYSYVLTRCSGTVTDIDNALVVIIIGGIVLWSALHYRILKTNMGACGSYNNGIPSRAILFWSISFLFQIFSSLGIPFISSLSEIISQFFINVSFVTLFLSVYCISQWKILTKKEKVLFLLILIIYIFWQTIQGNRSGIFAILVMMMVAFFALDRYTIRRSYLIASVVLVPLMLFSFSFATLLRQLGGSSGFRDSNTLALAEEVYKNHSDLLSQELLNRVFDRIGYLDYCCEMVKQRDKFSSFINVSSELKSVVDNALSPGFDVFDAPKISNLVIYFYNHGGVVSKKINSGLDYHSDELTLFGETAILFGIPFMFLVVFIIGIGLKTFWAKSGHDNYRVKCAIKHAVCLFLFNTILSSYGFDWLVMNIIQILFVYFFFNHLIINKRRLFH